MDYQLIDYISYMFSFMYFYQALYHLYRLQSPGLSLIRPSPYS